MALWPYWVWFYAIRYWRYTIYHWRTITCTTRRLGKNECNVLNNTFNISQFAQREVMKLWTDQQQRLKAEQGEQK